MENGVMIAFYPSPEMALALHTSLSTAYAGEITPPAEMHMTLAYLGEIEELEAQGITREKVSDVLKGLSTLLSPVKGQISGIGRFTNTHKEGMDAIVLLVDSPQLPETRQIITNELTAQGIPYAQNHGFTPHITLKYVFPEHVVDFRPPLADIIFDKLYLAWGDVDTEIVLEQTPEAPVTPEQPADPETLIETAEKEMSILEKAIALFRPRRKEVHMGFKALGNGRWMATFTNNFEDRQKEILAEKAHDRYIARLDAGIVPMPEFRFWHIPGSGHGKAEWVARAGHMVFAVGRFDDTPMGRAAEKHYQRNPGKYKVSHRFLYPLWAEKAGVIEDYNAYEISTAPKGAEVNPYTGFTTITEDTMPLSEEKKKALRSLFESEAVFQEAMKSIEAIEKEGDRIAGLAVKFKTFAELTPDPTPAPGPSSDLLLVLLENQKTLSDEFDLVEKALEGIKAHFDAKVAELETIKASLEAKEKALQLRLDEAPRSALDGAGAEVTGEEADKAKATIAQQKSGEQFDSFFGDMKVPAKSTN